MLYNSDNSVIYSALFALENICSLNHGFVNKLFDLGMDKALMQLNSTNSELFKPVIIFMTSVCPFVSNKYRYLVEGVQKTLATPESFKN